MKIILLAPPWSDVYGTYKAAARIGVLYPPLGLCYLDAIARQDGHEVEIIDAEAENFSIEQVIDRIAKKNPDLVGITSTTSIFHNAKKIANGLKERMDIPLIVGGPHITALPTPAMKECPNMDYGIFGEGEYTFRELIDCIENGGHVDKIDGLIHRDNGKIIKNRPRNLIKNLDELPTPTRDLLDSGEYLWNIPKKGIVKFATIQTTRGCPYQCIFCSTRTVFGKRIRRRDSIRVVDEMEDIVKKNGVKHFCFIDDTLTLDRTAVEEMCNEIIKRDLNITWEGWTRANTIDFDLLSLMKKSGFIRISFGIETGNPKIMKIIKKGVALEDIKKAYKLSKSLGIETRGSVMLGHPYETRETLMDTLNFIKNLEGCDQIHINVTTPYPGTELYEMAKRGEGGIRLLTEDFSKYMRYGNSVIEVNDLTREDLIEYQRKGFLMFYLTPRRIYYNIKRAGIKAAITNIYAFLRSIIFSPKK